MTGSLSPTAADWLAAWEEYRNECKAKRAWLEGSDEVIYQSVITHVPAIEREAVARGLDLVADRVAQCVWGAVAEVLRSASTVPDDAERYAIADGVRNALSRWWESPTGLPAYLTEKLGPATVPEVQQRVTELGAGLTSEVAE